MAKRIVKGAHISDKMFAEIIRLFSEDLTATQIANITGISRITVNAYVKLIRETIVKFCEKKYECHAELHDCLKATRVYGIGRSNGLLFTCPLPETSGIDGERSLCAIADFSSWKLLRLDNNKTMNGKPVMDDISYFWGLTKNRFQKFRGLHKNTLYLHVKESEFRYNLRQNNLQNALMDLFTEKW